MFENKYYWKILQKNICVDKQTKNTLINQHNEPSKTSLYFTDFFFLFHPKNPFNWNWCHFDPITQFTENMINTVTEIYTFYYDSMREKKVIFN